MKLNCKITSVAANFNNPAHYLYLITVVVITLNLTLCTSIETTIELATINFFSTQTASKGEEVTIFGDGFVTTSCEVIFDGNWKGGGMAPYSKRISIEANAISENEVVFTVPGYIFPDSCLTHLLFEGKVTVRMKSKGVAGGYIEGTRRRIKFDFLNDQLEGTKLCNEREKQLNEFLNKLGIKIEERPGGGAIIKHVEEKSRAFKTGIKSNDIIAVANGIKVLSAYDLLPPANSTVVSLLVFDPKGGKLKKSAVEIEKKRSKKLTPETLAISLIMLILILIFKLFGEQIFALTLLNPLQGKTAVAVFETEATIKTGRFVDKAIAVAFSMFFIIPAIAAISITLFKFKDQINIGILISILFILSTLSSIGEPRINSSPLASLIRRTTSGVFVSLPVSLSLIAGWIKSSRSLIGSVMENQSFYPTGWNGFEDPFSLVLMLCCLLSASVPERRKLKKTKFIPMHLFSLFAISTTVCTLMGGFSYPDYLQDFPYQKKEAITIFIFMAKVLTLYFLTQTFSLTASEAHWPSLTNMALLSLISLISFASTFYATAILSERIPQLHKWTFLLGVALFIVIALYCGKRKTSSTSHG